MLLHVRQTLYTQDLFHQVRITSGSVANGNGEVVIIIGAKVPGNMHGKATPGNQDIGKTVKRGIAGKKAIGNKRELMTC